MFASGLASFGPLGSNSYYGTVKSYYSKGMFKHLKFGIDDGPNLIELIIVSSNDIITKNINKKFKTYE